MKVEVGCRKTPSQVSHDKPHHVSSNNLKEFPPLQNRYSALYIEQDRLHEVNALDHSSSYIPQQRLEPASSAQKIDLDFVQFPKSFPRLVVGQPRLKITETQQVSTSVNLASFEKLKEKVVSAQHVLDGEMPQSVTRIEAIQQFEVSSNSIPIDNLIGKPISGQANIMGVEMAKGVDKLPCARFQFTVS